MYKRAVTWSLKEQAELLRHLSNLLQKGYTLKRALEFLQLYAMDKKKEQLNQSISELKTGRSLHEVFRTLQFHSDLLSYLFFAEQHGDIVLALRQGSMLLQRKQQRTEKLYAAFRYPIFLLLFFLAIVTLFNTVLLPQFLSLYGSVQATVSGTSALLISFLQTLPSLCIGMLILAGASGLYYQFRFRKLPIMRRMNHLLRLPFIKRCLRALHSHAFAVQLSSLLQGGLSVLDALTLMEQQEHQPALQHEAAEIKQQLIEGEKLEHILEQRPYYEEELLHVLAHGQANGTLAEELSDYGSMTLARLEGWIATGTAMIQPVFFLIIGFLVVLLYLAMLLPMFNMMQSI